MNVTLEMMVGLVAFLGLILACARFLYVMKADMMAQVTTISAQNAQFRLDFTNNIHDSETKLNDKLAITNNDVTKLTGRVDNAEGRIDEFMS